MNEIKMSEPRMDALIEEIEQHRIYYYRDNNPQIADTAYDALERELKEIEAAHPEWLRPWSPSLRVGSDLRADHPTREHLEPMLSLENAYDQADLIHFIERCEEPVGRVLDFEAELKIDGVSLSLVYEFGVLTRAVTRGDGLVGEEVTENAKTILGLPLRVTTWLHLPLMEVRGEVYMDRNNFEAMNQRRIEEDVALFANPRNAAAGTLRLLDSSEVAARKLRIFIYQANGLWAREKKSQHEVLDGLHQLGFPVSGERELVRGIEGLLRLIEKWADLRAKLNYGTDGIVFKVNDFEARQEIGFTSKFPKWAAAYKFPAEQATTRIKEIEVQVGRTGVLTPVANFEPVLLAGSTVARATLHNFDEIRKKDIRVGDWVFIEKGGDIIPKVVKVVTERREPGREPFPIPEICPRCGANVVREEEQVAIRCENLACPAQMERRIQHFASRKAMDIQGLGQERVQQMVERGMIPNLPSIYRLNQEQLWKLERVGDKWIANLLAEIEKSKQKPFSRLLFAVGIPMIGEKAAELLVERFESYEFLANATVDQIAEIHGLGEKVAESLVAHLQMPSYRQAFLDFEALGLNLSQPRARHGAGERPLEGKTIVVTGSFTAWDRTEATQFLKSLGANVTSSVTKKTDLLVAGEKAGSKLDKARALNVEIQDETWLMQWRQS